jgi:hypothetical protein
MTAPGSRRPDESHTINAGSRPTDPLARGAAELIEKALWPASELHNCNQKQVAKVMTRQKHQFRMDAPPGT